VKSRTGQSVGRAEVAKKKKNAERMVPLFLWKKSGSQDIKIQWKSRGKEKKSNNERKGGRGFPPTPGSEEKRKGKKVGKKETPMGGTRSGLLVSGGTKSTPGDRGKWETIKVRCEKKN